MLSSLQCLACMCARAHFATLQQLAFKHRLNKAGSQRIIAFVCSPVEEDERKLQRLGKELKKNSVRVAPAMHLPTRSATGLSYALRDRLPWTLCPWESWKRTRPSCARSSTP